MPLAVLVRSSLALLLLTAPGIARAQTAGALDLSFGDMGMAIVSKPAAFDQLNEMPIKALRQADGRVVVAGAYGALGAAHRSLFVARFLPDGSLDLSFGTGGSVLAPGPQVWAEGGLALALRPDGTVLVGGMSYPITGEVFLQVTPDGRRDPAFGTNGLVLGGSGDRHFFDSIVLLPDGRFIVGGNQPSGLWVTRYLQNGARDTTFGSQGIVRITRPTQNNHTEQVGQLCMQPDGKLLLHTVSILTTMEEWTVTRLNADGSLDTGFGVSGRVGLTLNGSNLARGSMALRQNGEIFLSVPRSGISNYSPNYYLARYSATGMYLGFISAPPTAWTGNAQQLTVLNDGTLIGALDGKVVEFGETFTQRGVITGSPGNITAASDGGFLVAGATNSGSDSDIEVKHYARDGTLIRTYFAELSTTAGNAVVTQALSARDGVVTTRIRSTGTGPAWNLTYNVRGQVQWPPTQTHLNQAPVLIIQGPKAPITLAPTADGWLGPWSTTKGPGKFVHNAPPATKFDRATCIVENALGEVFVGGEMQGVGAVRRFGVAGVTHVKVPANSAEDCAVVALAPRRDGGVLVLLKYKTGGRGRLMRLTPDMKEDITFGDNGSVESPLYTPLPLTEGTAIAELPDGRTVLTRANGIYWQLACLDARGQLTFYGANGVGATRFIIPGTGTQRAILLQPQPDSSLLVAGATDGGFAIGRWDRAGNPDPTFGANGLTEVLNGLDEPDMVAVLATDAVRGHTLVGGATLTRVDGLTHDAFVARFLPTPVTCQVTDLAALPRWAGNGYNQSFTVRNHTGAVRAVKVRIYNVPAGITVRHATWLPALNAWELNSAVTVAANATKQILVNYPRTFIPGRYATIPPLPRFLPGASVISPGP